MGRRGQFLERSVVLIQEPILEGLFHRGARAPGVVIVPPHPARGGSMQLPLIAEIAWALTQAGHPTLRFNYRGVGASGGEFADGCAAEDIERARAHLVSSLPTGRDAAVAGVGVGWGADQVADAARKVSGAYTQLVLVAPELADPEGPPPSIELAVVYPAETSREDAERFRAYADRAPLGRWVSVPRADPSFVRGLVDVGRVVAEMFEAPDAVDLASDGRRARPVTGEKGDA